MKIAITSDVDTKNISGVSKNTLLIKEELQKQGHKVKLFIPQTKNNKESTEDIIRVAAIQINKTPPFYLSSVVSSKMYKIFKEEEFDVIHCHTPLTMWWLSYQMSLFFDVPFIYTYHTIVNDYLHYLGQLGESKATEKSVKYFERATCNPCDLIICPSEKVEERLKSFKIKTPTKIVPNGIDIKRFSNAQGGYLGKNFNIGEDNILLVVGRVDEEKDPIFSVEVLNNVLKEVPNTKLVFAGNGNLQKDVGDLARKYGIEENVIVTGYIDYDDIPDIYRDADIYLSASTTENHSLAVIEAISAGLPAVVPDDKSFSANVKNNRNGYLCKKDPEVFAKKIVNILKNEDLKEKMSEESLSLSKEFSAEKHVKDLVKIYKSLQ